MKREPTPTAPAQRAQRKNSKANIMRTPFSYLILAIIFGFIAGFLGHLISRNYPMHWPYGPEIANNGYALNGEQEEVLVIKDSAHSDYPVLIEHVLDKNRAALVSIYAGTQRLATGMVLTNDGWLVTLNSALTQDQVTIITKDKKIYPVQEVVRDAYSGFAFLKIEAQNLSVVEFTDAQNLKLGNEVLIYHCMPTQQDYLMISYLANINYYADALRSTSRQTKNYLLTDAVDPAYATSPVIDMNGKVVGFFSNNNYIIPSGYINQALTQVIQNSKVATPDLGVSYYALAQSINLDSSLTQEKENGALLQQSNKYLDLKVNDIILKVEDQEIDLVNDLTILLQNYSVGQIIALTVLRQGEEIEVEIEL